MPVKCEFCDHPMYRHLMKDGFVRDCQAEDCDCEGFRLVKGEPQQYHE